MRVGSDDTCSVPGYESPGRHIPRDHGAGCNHRAATHANELVDRSARCDDCASSDLDVSAQLRPVAQDNIGLQPHIVAHVGISHYQDPVTDLCDARAGVRAAVNGGELPNLNIFANLEPPGSASKTVLSRTTQQGPGVDSKARPGAQGAFEHRT